MRVDDLSGNDLDHWVAKANGWKIKKYPDYDYWVSGEDETIEIYIDAFRPSSDWISGGPIIDELKITFDYDHDDFLDGKEAYSAYVQDLSKPVYGMRGFYEEKARARGKSVLIASCRAYVKSVFGDTVDE